MNTTHYSYALDMTKLPKIMERFAKKIATIVERTGRTPILIYSGMSGTAHATALAMKLADIKVKHHMVYVRKPEDVSHGDTVEHNMGAKWFHPDMPVSYCLIFVDDLIASGTTQKRCISAFRDEFGVRGPIAIHECLAAPNGGRPRLRLTPKMLPA